MGLSEDWSGSSGRTVLAQHAQSSELTPQHTPSMVAHTCHLRERKEDVQSDCQLHSKLEANLGCMRPCLKISKQTKPQTTEIAHLSFEHHTNTTKVQFPTMSAMKCFFLGGVTFFIARATYQLFAYALSNFISQRKQEGMDLRNFPLHERCQIKTHTQAKIPLL